MSKPIFVEIAVLTAPRLLLFFASRKYLLRSLYSDLQSLSSELSSPETPVRTTASNGLNSPPTGEPGIELGSLPLPSTHAVRANKHSHSELHSTVSRTVFSACFSEGCMMFFLLMLQGLDMFSPRTRLINWRFSLAFLMAAILVLIPMCVSLFLTVGTKANDSPTKRLLGPRVFLSLVPVALYLFAVSHIPLPAALSSSDIMTATLSRLIVLGTIILGLLSGFGAISNSWAFIPASSRSRGEPTDQDISSAEYALSSIRNDLRDRRAEAERRAGTPVEGTWLSRVVPNFRGGDGYLQEIQGLEALEYQMTRNLSDLRHRREAAKFASSFKGRLFNLGGRIFAIYCVVRILSSIMNVFFPAKPGVAKPTYADLIADLIAYLLSLLSPSDIKHADVAVFAHQLSLALVGFIILSSIRRVLQGVTRALRVTSRNLGASLMLLLLAQLMGIYLLSTVVQLRTSFPPPTAHPLGDAGDDVGGAGTTPAVTDNLFSTVPEYEVFGPLFDWSFLVVAGASAFVRWGAERVNGPGGV